MLDIPEKEHKAIVKKAIREANKEQKDFMDNNWKKRLHNKFSWDDIFGNNSGAEKAIVDFIQSLLQEVGEKCLENVDKQIDIHKKLFVEVVSNDGKDHHAEIIRILFLQRKKQLKTLQDYGVKIK